MYDDDDDPARAFLRRRQKLEAARCRWDAEQREVLIAAARTMLPDHGLALPLGRIAVQAGLPVATARRLFNSTVDLAVAMVDQAWTRLIEGTARGDTVEAMLAHLIFDMRAGRALQRIHAALTCGAALWQRQNIDTTEAGLTLAVGLALHDRSAALARLPAEALGQQALALLRVAALLRPGSDARAEARTIAAMLDAAALAAPEPAADPVWPTVWDGTEDTAPHAPAPDAPAPDAPALAALGKATPPDTVPPDAPPPAAASDAPGAPDAEAGPTRPPAVYPFDWSVINPAMAARRRAAEAAEAAEEAAEAAARRQGRRRRTTAEAPDDGPPFPADWAPDFVFETAAPGRASP